MAMMTSSERIVWTEGTFLGPQHLQQSDLYHERSLAARLAALWAHPWGLSHLKIDEATLATGVLKIDELIAVLPDGLAVHVAPGGLPLTTRPVEGHFPATARRLEVFVGAPREREGVDNYALDGQERPLVRYTCYERAAPDLTCAQRSAATMFARPHLQVLFGDEPREDFSVLKVAEVVRGPTGLLGIDHGYIAPVCRVGAAPAIMAGLHEMVKLIHARRRELAAAFAASERPGVGVDAAVLRQALFFAATSAYLPPIKAMAEAGTHDPRSVYDLLQQAAGQLGAFAVGEDDDEELPPLVHNDLRAGFSAVFRRLHAILGAAVQARCLEIALQRRADGAWQADLDDGFFACKLHVLGVRSGLDPQAVWKEMEQHSKIASASDLAAIIKTAVPGVALEPLPHPPPEVPARKGMAYFALRPRGDLFWDHIASERTIAVFPAPNFRAAGVQLELFAVPRAGR